MDIDTRDTAVLLKLQSVDAASEKARFSEIWGDSKRLCQKLYEAEALLWGLWLGILARINGELSTYSSERAERDALFATFKLGRSLVVQSIFEGRLSQAMALVRQELETYAQIVAIREQRRHAKKAPLISPLRKDIRILYGELSRHAHLMSHDLPRHMSEHRDEGLVDGDGINATAYYPTARDPELTRKLYALHVVLVKDVWTEFAMDVRESNPNAVTEHDYEVVIDAMKMCAEEGLVNGI